MSSPLSASRPAPAAGAPAPEHPRLHRVLIVDDEESILRSVQRLLRNQPYEVVTAGGAKEAIAIFERETVHLVMADHRMPGRTGVELLREIRDRWPETIRIILSGYTEVKAIIGAVNDGEVYKYFTKPWNDEEIKINLRRALEQYDLQAENRRLTEEIVAQNERLRQLNALLDQRAADATAGFTSFQRMLDGVEVMVLTIDAHGLIVAANAPAMRLTTTERPELIGTQAHRVLPAQLHPAIDGSDEAGDEHTPAAGRLTIDGKRYQWRRRAIRDGETFRGWVVAVWEEVTEEGD